MDLVHQQRLKIKARYNGRMRYTNKMLRVHRRKNLLIVNYGRFQMCFRRNLVRYRQTEEEWLEENRGIGEEL